MHWFFLTIAIILEVCGTLALKMSQGLSRPGPLSLVVVFYAMSFASLSLAIKKIDIGVAYALWSGCGTALIGVIGMLVFDEPVTLKRLLSLFLVLVGVVGLLLPEVAH